MTGRLRGGPWREAEDYEDELEEAREPRASEPAPPASSREAFSLALITTGVTAASVAFAYDPARAGTAAPMACVLTTGLLLGVLALSRLARRGELRPALMPRPGDLFFGATAALMLYAGLMALGLAVARRGAPGEGWMAALYVQLGHYGAGSLEAGDAGPDHVTGALVFIAFALEGLAFRALVQRPLGERLGPLRGLFLAALLGAVAYVPSALLLEGAAAGPNPLLVAAAFGAHLVGGIVAVRARHLTPSLVAHALFAWAVYEFPLWRP